MQMQLRGNTAGGRLSVLLVITILVIVGAPSASPAVAQIGTFIDDDGSVHEPNIEAVAEAGITLGCNPPTNNRFCPNDHVTRGQMAAFLVRARSLATAAGPDTFIDDDGSVFESNIEAVAAAEITRGCNPPDNDRYCPDDVVTRGQMAAFLVRAFSYPMASTFGFSDTVGSVFEGDIDALAAQRVTLGCNPPDNTLFCPEEPVTRSEMATFLARALRLVPIIPVAFDPDWYTTPEPIGLGARTIVVSPGQSPTLADALATAQPGDVIELTAGTHTNTTGNLVLGTSGTPGRWIAIRGAPGTRPLVDLEGLGELRISASNVLVENLEIVDGMGNNLHIAPQSESISHIIVRNVRIHGLRDGPGAAIKINRNNAALAGISSVYVEDSDVSEARANAVIDGVGVSQVVVRGSHIHDNEPGSHGVFFKGGSDGVLIEGNLISGIRQNAALQLGGNTGFQFFNPAWPDWEGVNQVVRNNLIADFTDSAVEIRGVLGARVYHNTIVTQSAFAIFRLACGNTDSAALSGNVDIDIANNLVISTGGDPQYARNDCFGEEIRFGRNAWFGLLHSGSPTPFVPDFPQTGDIRSTATVGAVADPTITDLIGLAAAVSKYSPLGLVVGAGDSLAEPVLFDVTGAPRSQLAPTLGAVE